MSYSVKKISELFSNIKIGGTPSRGNPAFFNGNKLWVSIKDMKGQSLITSTAEKLSDEGVAKSNCKLVVKGSMLFSFKLTVGKVAFAGADLYTNEAIAAFDPVEAKENGIDLDYLSMVLPIAAKGDTTKNSMGASLLSKDRIYDLEIPVPNSIEEQKTIAKNYLEKFAEIEKAREATTIQRTELRKLLDKLLEYEIETVLNSNGENVKLGDVIEISAKMANPSSPKYCDLLHVSAENIESVTGKLINLKSAKDDGMTSNKYFFDKGDVLYSKLRPYLRKIALPDFSGLCSADMYPIKCNPDLLDSRFLKLLLTSKAFTEYANEMSARSRMPKLNRDQLYNWKFSLPSIEIQQSITSKIEHAMKIGDEGLKASDNVIASINILPNKLLQEAFNETEND